MSSLSIEEREELKKELRKEIFEELKATLTIEVEVSGGCYRRVLRLRLDGDTFSECNFEIDRN